MQSPVTIRGHDGAALGDARVTVVGESVLVLDPSRPCRNELLRYYFFHHGRQVTIEGDAITVRGALRTRLDGTRRVWLVALRRAFHHDGLGVDSPLRDTPTATVGRSAAPVPPSATTATTRSSLPPRTSVRPLK